MLCTSGFVDAVVFSYNGPKVRHVYSSAIMEHDQCISRDFKLVLLNDKDRNTHCELRTDCPVFSATDNFICLHNIRMLNHRCNVQMCYIYSFKFNDTTQFGFDSSSRFFLEVGHTDTQSQTHHCTHTSATGGVRNNSVNTL